MMMDLAGDEAMVPRPPEMGVEVTPGETGTAGMTEDLIAAPGIGMTETSGVGLTETIVT